MIIVDFSQIFISNLMVQCGNHADQVEPNLIRHMVLNSLRGYRKKYSAEYGELVIACDGKNCWRKEVFPPYKAHRKRDRDDSPLDWNYILGILDDIKNELREYFPYPILSIDRVEADDIIAVLVQNFHNEKILILSGDHDFAQLHQYPNVVQYNPIQKKFVMTDDPKRDLFEHILRGDKGDGVPNYLSPDNTFIAGKRQSKLYETKVKELLDDPRIYLDPGQVLEGEDLRNFQRNQQLVDLELIPDAYKTAILDHYHGAVDTAGDRSKIMNYMVKNQMRNLLSQINDF